MEFSYLVPRYLILLAGVILASSGSALAVPVLTGISPASGPTAGGSLITLTGQSFGSTPQVSIGSRSATVQPGGNDTFVVVSSPAGEGANLDVKVIAAGSASNSLSFSYLSPSISSLTPATGPTAGGISLTVVGSNFGLSPSVTLGGNSASVIARTHSQVVCTLPAGQGLDREVRVAVAGQVSPPAYFNYASPLITSISPATGPTAGGTQITINGSNFGTAPVAVFDGVSVNPLAGSTHTRVIISSPPGYGTGKNIALLVGGQLSNSLNFSYDAPSLSAITPGTGPTAGNISITLTGASFGPDPTVSIGGANAPLLSGATDSLLVCTLPAGQGLDRVVRVTSQDQRSSNSLPFNYLAPAITSIAAQSAPTAGNVPITIRGSNFGLSSSVTIGDQPAPVTLSSHETLIAQLPEGEGTGLPLVVTTGGQISNTFAFDYDAPLIASLTPATAPTVGGTVITIIGSNFGTAPTASLSGNPLAFLTVGHTQVTAVLPAGQGADLPLVVTTAGGRASQALSFSYTPPAITSISPASAPTAGNVPITVVGSNFGISPLVSIGGRSAPVQFSTASQIIASLPAGEGTDLPVLVNAGGQISNTANFSYDAPLLTSISPASGPTLGGSVITLKGSSFGLAPSVTIGGVTAPITQGGHTQLLVTLPTGEGKDLQVSLRTADNRLASPLLFSYFPPQITSISPANGPTSGGTVITVRGSNFGNSKVVTIGGKSAVAVAAGGDGEVLVTTPVGTGSSLPLAMTTAGQVSNTLLFSYDPVTFASWESTIAWGGLSSAPESDPRGNGWKNLLSYALGVNPPTTHGGEIASRNPVIFGRPAMTTDALGRLQIGFWCRRPGYGDDLVYQVQFGGDLAGTAWEPATRLPEVDVWNDVWEYRVVTDHSSEGGRRFARLRVETISPPSP